MLILGWSRKTRSVEATLTQECEKCARTEMFRLEIARTWITLLGIPLIPYDTQYWLTCTECKSGQRLSCEEHKALIREICRQDTQGTYMTLTRT